MRTDIHIDWAGPYTYDQAVQIKNNQDDYGVYQIYGTHPVYGADVLLYIGKANKQTFGVRLSQEAWRATNSDSSGLSVYVGRLGGYGGTPSNEKWSDQITVAERMLIVAHWPAGNSSGLNVFLGGRIPQHAFIELGKLSQSSTRGFWFSLFQSLCQC